LHSEFNVNKKDGWNILNGYDNIKNEVDLSKFIQPISYRPFDNRYVFYEDKLVWRTVRKVMQHFIKGDNIGLVAARQCVGDWKYVFCTKLINEFNLTGTAGRLGSGNTFPLYLYPEATSQQTLDQSTQRIPNLNPEILKQIAEGLGLKFTNEKNTSTSSVTNATFAPIDLLDYIYAVLHSPSYREKYKEFLKIDFPRVPYPTNQETFWKLVKLGGEIRQIHLLESPEVSEYITQYPIDGDNIVTKIKFELNYEIIDGDSTILMDPVYPMGRVYINDTQFFQMVPEVAWNFYIGGYQPAQKWLKDRKSRELGFEDILHYQKIIVALFRTDEIMKEIDLIEL
jgi:predicted helicase